MVTMTTVSFYMITAYTPTFGSSVLHLAATDSLVVTLCVGASNLFWLPDHGQPVGQSRSSTLTVRLHDLDVGERLSSDVVVGARCFLFQVAGG